MDVRCERCRAQYVFDDAQVTEAGLTVKCSNCGHLFKVKKKALVVTVPVKPGEAAEPHITAKMSVAGGTGAPAGAPAPAVTPLPSTTPSGSPIPPEKREWRVRQANGNVFTFKELTTLQKWIVEKKVSRDDEISLSGDQWKRLGNIAELATFFQVVEAAERGQSAPPPALTPLPMPPVYAGTGAYPLGYPPGYAPQMPAYPPTTPVPFQPSPPVSGSVQVNVGGASGAAWESQPPTAPRAGAPDPAWTRGGHRGLPDAELHAEDVTAVKGSGWKVALLAFLVVIGGGGAALYLKPELLVTLGLRAPPAPPPVQATPPARPEAPPAAQATPPAKPEPPPAQAPPAATPEPPAVAQAPPPARSEPPVPAPEPPKAEPSRPEPQPSVEKAPVAGKAPVTPKEPAPPPAKPAPKGVKQLLAEARKLRERGKLEKALDLYGRVAEVQPENPEALAGRGWCYLDLSQYQPAEASFQAALEEDPTHAEALIGLAETYRYQGRRPEAVTYYQRYLAAHPNGEDAVAARNALGQLKE
ncbi:MAG TPA: tetratricopeptide repeat protein [Anaeromyxobacteraceae bacterium]|nr:tetratricopeptide repeat protein [Anaeromyxobacteraceae bacterium]